MDFAWVVDALRRGLKVTRRAWAGDPPMYLYVLKEENGEKAIMRYSGTEQDSKWYPRPELILDTTDWEEYVEPKKKPVFGNTKLSFDENGQPHMGDTMTVEEYQKVHSGEERTPAPRQEGPFVINSLPLTGTMGMHGGKSVEDQDIDAETNKAIALVARNIAENLVELLQNPSVQRILQLRGKVNTNHV